MRAWQRLLCVLLAAAGQAAALDVRVLVAQGPQVPVRLLGTQAQPTPAPATWQVTVRGGKLALSGRDSGSATLYLPPSPGSLVEIAGVTYRGGVLLRAEGNRVQGINVVDIEDYLRGVVPAEMPALWPDAALQAQAVVARTYVTSRVNPKQPYDICATQNCQMYPGVRGEHDSSNRAVAATAGQVVTYGGKLADTYFSADSGGYTASAQEAWGRPQPYLIAQPDPYSQGAAGPKASWRITVPQAKVQQVVTQFRLNVGTVQTLKVGRASASGRVEEVLVSGSRGSARVRGAEAGGFVRALGAPSSRVMFGGTVSAAQPLVVAGQGSGHGVGLSQYGALALARAGQSHRAALNFYYPGTQVGQLAVPAAQAEPAALSQPLALGRP
ncbi:SpoIID/LytB domain-containing protein [Deinococcus lacus]|uniref:SpoIID/LytB domain-containing protein n=1 Tax=Deinococcus lacus TaxID=392561 RepID=A0ABW1YDD4_9DEIO